MTLDHFRGGFRTAAFVCSIASGLLTFVFGLHQGVWYVGLACAAFLVACSLASDYIWLFVVDAWRRRQWIMGTSFTLGAIFVLSLNLMSNLGSVGWQRDVQITGAQVKKAAYAAEGDNVADLEAEAARIKASLDKAKAENGWITTQTASALRAQRPAIELEMEREGRTGKGPRYQGWLNKLSDLDKQIALAESYDENTRKLEGLTTRLAVARSKAIAAGQNVQIAAPASQSDFFASLATANLTPSTDSKIWTNRSIASWLALGLCFAPILFSLIGWRTKDDAPNDRMADFRQRRSEDEAASARLDVPAIYAASAAQPAMQMGFVPPQPKSQRLVAQTVQQRLAAIAAGTA